jgi:uridine kinase
MVTNKRPAVSAMPVQAVELDVPLRLRDWVSNRCGAIGVNGLDGAGKTTYALGLQRFLENQGRESCLLHVDDFNNDEVQDEIYEAFSSGELTSAHLDKYYRSSVDYRALFDAIKMAKQRTRYVVVEGVFLFKQPLPQILDFKVFLETEPSVARDRFEQRQLELGDGRPVEVFDRIWLPAFERYCVEESPLETADLIVAGR